MYPVTVAVVAVGRRRRIHSDLRRRYPFELSSETAWYKGRQGPAEWDDRRAKWKNGKASRPSSRISRILQYIPPSLHISVPPLSSVSAHEEVHISAVIPGARQSEAHSRPSAASCMHATRWRSQKLVGWCSRVAARRSAFCLGAWRLGKISTG